MLLATGSDKCYEQRGDRSEGWCKQKDVAHSIVPPESSVDVVNHEQLQLTAWVMLARSNQCVERCSFFIIQSHQE